MLRPGTSSSKRSSEEKREREKRGEKREDEPVKARMAVDKDGIPLVLAIPNFISPDAQVSRSLFSSVSPLNCTPRKRFCKIS